jgi:hypothetical protein
MSAHVQLEKGQILPQRLEGGSYLAQTLGFIGSAFPRQAHKSGAFQLLPVAQ